MEKLLAAINQPIDSEIVRSIIHEFHLESSPGVDLSDVGLEQEFYLSSVQNGIRIRYFADNTVKIIDLFSEGTDGFHQYPRKLIEGLDFDSTRKEVLQVMGAPTKSGQPGRTPFGDHGAWDLVLSSGSVALWSMQA